MKLKLNLLEKDCLSDSVRYLGTKINKKLSWKHHVNNISAKQNRKNIFLC